MNKSWVLQQLHQAQYYLDCIVRDLEAAKDDDGFGEFSAQLPFVYRHLNCSWNTRGASDVEIDKALKCDECESVKWRGFPHDLEVFLHDSDVQPSASPEPPPRGSSSEAHD